MTRESISPARRQPLLTIPNTTASTMQDVFIALIPALVMATYYYGLRSLTLTLVSIVASILFECLYRRLTHQRITIADGSACVTGLILALCLPPTAPYWAPVLGAFFSIVVAKQFYGGLGRNFLNPALAGRMILCTFPTLMTTWSPALIRLPVFGAVDAVSAATPMAYLHNDQLPPLSTMQLFLGQHGGSIGEGCSLLLLLGGLYLMMRRVITPRIPISFLGTVAVLTFLFPRAGTGLEWMTAQLFSGGLILGAFFMATDYVTSPTTPYGQIYFGIGCGFLTVLLRYFGSYPDGVGWAILTMNCMVFLLDRIGKARPYGVPRFSGLRRWWEHISADLADIQFVRPDLSKSELKKNLAPGETLLDPLRRMIRPAVSITLIVLACLLMVEYTHSLTELRIRQREDQELHETYALALPAADIITETPYRSADAVSISAGYNENQLVGYCVEVLTSGFGGSMQMAVGVDTDGRVTGIAIIDHKETVTIGTKALDLNFLQQFVGRSGTIRTTSANDIDTISGATVTSNAIVAGVNKALSIVANLDSGSEVTYTDGEV